MWWDRSRSRSIESRDMRRPLLAASSILAAAGAAAPSSHNLHKDSRSTLLFSSLTSPSQATSAECRRCSPAGLATTTTLLFPCQPLRQTIIKTQKNVTFNVHQQTPHGHYIQAEVDGGFGRDFMEFLVKKDAGVVAYRCVTTKITFLYPFTTAVGDSGGRSRG